MGRVHRVLVTVLGLGAWSAMAHGQAPRLDYAAGDECPDATVFEELVQARLGRAPFDPESDATVQVHVTGGTALMGSIQWIDRNGEVLGERHVEAHTRECRELTESLAVAVSILLEDPPVRPDRPEPIAPPVVAPPVVAPPVVAPAVAPAVEPAREETVRVVVLSVGPHTGFGFTPRPTLGANLGVGVRWTLVGIYLRLGFDVQLVRARLRTDEVDARHYGGAIDLCVHPGNALACLSTEVGALQAVVQTVSDPRDHTSMTSSVGLRVGWEFPVSPLVSIAPWASLSVAVQRTALQVDGTTVWEASPLLGRIGLDIRLSLR